MSVRKVANQSQKTTEGVRDLEPLQAIAPLGLLADHIQHGIDELGALRAMTAVVSCATSSSEVLTFEGPCSAV